MVENGDLFIRSDQRWLAVVIDAKLQRARSFSIEDEIPDLSETNVFFEYDFSPGTDGVWLTTRTDYFRPLDRFEYELLKLGVRT